MLYYSLYTDVCNSDDVTCIRIDRPAPARPRPYSRPSSCNVRLYCGSYAYACIALRLSSNGSVAIGGAKGGPSGACGASGMNYAFLQLQNHSTAKTIRFGHLCLLSNIV